MKNDAPDLTLFTSFWPDRMVELMRELSMRWAKDGVPQCRGELDGLPGHVAELHRLQTLARSNGNLRAEMTERRALIDGWYILAFTQEENSEPINQRPSWYVLLLSFLVCRMEEDRRAGLTDNVGLWLMLLDNTALEFGKALASVGERNAHFVYASDFEPSVVHSA